MTTPTFQSPESPFYMPPWPTLPASGTGIDRKRKAGEQSSEQHDYALSLPAIFSPGADFGRRRYVRRSTPSTTPLQALRLAASTTTSAMTPIRRAFTFLQPARSERLEPESKRSRTAETSAAASALALSTLSEATKKKSREIVDRFKDHPKSTVKECLRALKKDFREITGEGIKLTDEVLKTFTDLMQKQDFCRRLIEKLGTYRGLQLFKDLVKIETAREQPETLFRGLSSSGIAIMTAVINTAMPELSASVKQFVSSFPPDLLLKLNSTSTYMKESGKQELCDLLLRKIEWWTIATHDDVQKINSHFKEVAHGVFERSNKEGAEKFAYHPFFLRYLNPLLINAAVELPSEAPNKQQIIAAMAIGIRELQICINGQNPDLEKLEPVSLRNIVRNINPL